MAQLHWLKNTSKLYRASLKGGPQVARNFCLALPGCCLAKLVHLLEHLCTLCAIKFFSAWPASYQMRFRSVIQAPPNSYLPFHRHRLSFLLSQFGIHSVIGQHNAHLSTPFECRSRGNPRSQSHSDPEGVMMSRHPCSKAQEYCWDVLKVSTVFLSGLWGSPIFLFRRRRQMIDGI